jgi:pimeloyl-ACP methyl ester carboxylesterase
MHDFDVITPDGRTLSVLESGEPDGWPILMHAGMPNSRLQYGPVVAIAQRQGVRLISYDRPGYGRSTAQPGRSMGSCCDDVRAIAEALDIDRLGVWGISGGGPHALACAALLEDLVVAVASLASPAPFDADGLDYYEGMGEMNVEDIRMSIEDPVSARAKCEQDRVEYIATEPDTIVESMSTLVSPVDEAALTGELAEFYVACARDGLAPGADGWWDDGVALVTPWGFELDAIRTPVLVRHGRQDRFVPFGHGEWLAGRIPTAQAALSDDDGHLTLVANHIAATHEWLLERMG